MVGLGALPNSRAASASSAARLVSNGVASHAGAAGAGVPSRPGSRTVARGAKSRNAERADESVAIDRLAEQPADFGLVEIAAGMDWNQSEQARGRIEVQRPARQFDTLREGQVGEGAAEHEVGLPGRERLDRLLRSRAAQHDFLLLRRLIVGRQDLAREPQRIPAPADRTRR